MLIVIIVMSNLYSIGIEQIEALMANMNQEKVMGNPCLIDFSVCLMVEQYMLAIYVQILVDIKASKCTNII